MPPVQPELTSQTSALSCGYSRAAGCIFSRRARQEWRRKTRRELRLHADQSLFGAGNLCGVAGKEVVHGLRRREFCDRRHHAESVGSEKDDVLRMAGPAGLGGIGHEVERIGRARVLRLGLIVKVANPRLRIEHDVFKHGPEPIGRRVDFRLSLLRKLDAFGVTPALEIEHAVRPPAMLIVANEFPGWDRPRVWSYRCRRGQRTRRRRRPCPHWPSSASA